MLQKTSVPINFSAGLDTKSDPHQVQVGKFLTLTNSVFNTAGRLTKRNGFANITTLPNEDQTNLVTLNDNLIATGSNLYTFNESLATWTNKGSIQPIQLDTLSLVRSSTSQSSPDSATSTTGIVCTAYVDGGLVYYQVADSTTGQQLVSRTFLGNSVSSPRVYILGQYFIITFKSTIAATPHLQYIAIPTSNPTNPGTITDVSATLPSAAGYDCIVANNRLYISYADVGTTIKTRSLSSTLTLSSATSLAAHTATKLSITADVSGATAVIWVSFWDSGTGNGYTIAYGSGLNSTPILAATQIITATTINNITSAASASILTVLYENSNTYASPYPTANVTSNYISKLTVTISGTVSAASVMLRSVGLASKMFVHTSGTIYVLVAYGEANQPTYFLSDSSGNLSMRLAYSNGGGYIAGQILPNVSLVDDVYTIAYMIKDFLAPVNKGTSLPSGTPTSGIYTQTGINLAMFSINASNQYASEIADALHLTGGQLWEFDTVKPVEHGFHVWPENTAAQGKTSVGSMTTQIYYYVFTYEWTDNAGKLHRSAPSIPLTFTITAAPANFTGNRTSGSPIITSVSSLTGLQVGQLVSGTGIPATTYILSIDSATQITLTNNASSGSATSTTITPVTLSALNLYVPTLRLTYKVSPNPVRVVGYRWSTAQQTYYQFTSITSPTSNSTTTDYVTIADTNSDAQILGQTLLYTTGGVVENIAAPASIASALYKNRVFLVDAEDQNLLWYSKQVIEGVPVEMSDLFTLYIAPTSGAQGSTGPITALSAMDDKLIIFKQDAIYYLTGTGPDNTGAGNDFSDPVFVTSSVGCANPSSIVLMPNGIMFQSDKGIWLLSRDLSTSYIGSDVDSYNSKTVMSAETIPGTNQVRFILDNSITLMFDYFYNQWGTFSNINAISATLYQGNHTYLNQYGQVYQEAPGTYLDGSRPVLMSFKTGWINIAGLQGYERFYFMYLLGNYYTPFKLNVALAYDYNSGPSQGVIVTPDNYSPNWGGDTLWGSGTAWGGPGKIFEARVFPKVQKCEAFQISITEIFDASFGVMAGQGLTLSGLNLIVGTKRGYRVNKSSRNFG